MFGFAWKLLKRTLFAVLALAVVFGTIVAYLGVRTMEPRASSEWRRLPDLPNPRGEVAAAVGARLADDDTAPFAPGESALDQLFVIGGISGLGSTVATVDVYDPSQDRWLRAPDLPLPLHHLGAAGIGGVVFAGGGARTATDWTPVDSFWRLLPTEEAWEELPEMPDARMGHQLVAVQGKLYVIGGRGETSNVLIYDPMEGAWSTGAQMPSPRDHLGVTVAGTQIFAIGGRDETLTDRVDIYDVPTDRWIEGPPLPEPMSAMATGTLTDGIHVVGGEEPATLRGKVLDRHYVLAPGSNEWTEAPLPILATHGSAATVLRGALVITGGSRRQGALSPIGWTGLTEAYAPPSERSPAGND